MSKSVRITVLVENCVRQSGLAAEHGLSLYIETGQYRLLFDTGQTDLFLRNAKSLGIELGRLDAIVLSHGHYDHTGGLPSALDAAPKASVFLHPAALSEKFSKKSDRARSIGMRHEVAEAIHRRPGFVETSGWTEVVDGVYATGEIPRTNRFEDTGGPFFLDAEFQRPDPLLDDQAVVIDQGRRLILLLGCAHAGVVNTLDHVGRRFSNKPVYAVLGGLHLGSAGEERLRQTIARLRAADLHLLAAVHCTGWPATARLWQAFPETCRPAGVGTVFEF